MALRNLATKMRIPAAAAPLWRLPTPVPRVSTPPPRVSTPAGFRAFSSSSSANPESAWERELALTYKQWAERDWIIISRGKKALKLFTYAASVVAALATTSVVARGIKYRSQRVAT